MLMPGDKIKSKDTEEVYVMTERLPLSWVKVFEKQDDPDTKIQIFPWIKIRLFTRVKS